MHAMTRRRRAAVAAAIAAWAVIGTGLPAAAQSRLGTAASSTAFVHPGRPGATGPALAAAGPGSLPGGSCQPHQTGPTTWTVVCVDPIGLPGAPGSPGSGRRSALVCGLTPLSESQLLFLGLPKAPPGEHWAAITCTGTQPFGGVVLVGRAGRPPVTPAELLRIAITRLHVPVLPAETAPPPGKPGLVGLPEWFWVPRGRWQPVSVTVTAGLVEATATATPLRLTFSPGAGLAGQTCAGPGTAFRPAAGDQQSSCSYSYERSSALQPHHAYQAAVIVGWRVTWTGSGGAGGVLDQDLQVAEAIQLRVAEGQALVTSR